MNYPTTYNSFKHILLQERIALRSPIVYYLSSIIAGQ